MRDNPVNACQLIPLFSCLCGGLQFSPITLSHSPAALLCWAALLSSLVAPEAASLMEEIPGLEGKSYGNEGNEKVENGKTCHDGTRKEVLEDNKHIITERRQSRWFKLTNSLPFSFLFSISTSFHFLFFSFQFLFISLSFHFPFFSFLFLHFYFFSFSFPFLFITIFIISISLYSCFSIIKESLWDDLK